MAQTRTSSITSREWRALLDEKDACIPELPTNSGRSRIGNDQSRSIYQSTQTTPSTEETTNPDAAAVLDEKVFVDDADGRAADPEPNPVEADGASSPSATDNRISPLAQGAFTP